MKLQFSRILLKLSGESLGNEKKNSINVNKLSYIAQEIKKVQKLGVQIAIVIGGGNIFRGAANIYDMDRVTADNMGMLATVFNSLALQNALEQVKIKTKVQSAIEIKTICKSYIRTKAIKYLEEGIVVIFAGGTGNPYFTTDTAASLRASEINANAILKATKVDGVFNEDPIKQYNAIMYKKLSYIDILTKKIKIMDYTAISMCMDNNISIYIFNVTKQGNMQNILYGKKIGTEICNIKD